MKSMTGYGRGVVEQSGQRTTVEIRSVNHRFSDVKIRAPWVDVLLEEEITRAIRQRTERGAFTVHIRHDNAFFVPHIQVNIEAGRRIARELELLRTSLGLADPLSLSLVAAQPGVLTISEDATSVRWDMLRPAVIAALDALIAMRETEGRALEQDLLARLDVITQWIDDIATFAAQAPDDWHQRLLQRLHQWNASLPTPVDEARIVQEAALLAERIDITEEIVRVKSHLSQARALLFQKDPIGRRLDFLLQELGREFHTINAKSISLEINRRIVDAKYELEKIREQVQNVE